MEVAHARDVAALAQAAFGDDLAVDQQAVGLGRRVREAVTGFEREYIVAGAGTVSEPDQRTE